MAFVFYKGSVNEKLSNPNAPEMACKYLKAVNKRFTPFSIPDFLILSGTFYKN